MPAIALTLLISVTKERRRAAKAEFAAADLWPVVSEESLRCQI